jgi:hypothetical protein
MAHRHSFENEDFDSELSEINKENHSDDSDDFMYELTISFSASVCVSPETRRPTPIRVSTPMAIGGGACASPMTQPIGGGACASPILIKSQKHCDTDDISSTPKKLPKKIRKKRKMLIRIHIEEQSSSEDSTSSDEYYTETESGNKRRRQ